MGSRKQILVKSYIDGKSITETLAEAKGAGVEVSYGREDGWRRGLYVGELKIVNASMNESMVDRLNRWQMSERTSDS